MKDVEWGRPPRVGLRFSVVVAVEWRIVCKERGV